MEDSVDVISRRRVFEFSVVVAIVLRIKKFDAGTRDVAM